jgi:hypothetical protein
LSKVQATAVVAKVDIKIEENFIVDRNMVPL